MKFTPKTSHEIETDGLFEKGEYDFEVVKASEEVSAKGNEMIKLNVRVFSPDGRAQFVFDYLMEKIAYKLRHFCEATGLLGLYESGELEADDCVGKTGTLYLAIDNKNKDFPPKNVIKDYIVPEAVKNSDVGETKGRPAKASPDPDLDVEDDDIPF